MPRLAARNWLRRSLVLKYMRTLIIIVIGFVIWVVCLGLAKLLANASAASLSLATAAFVAIWFLIAAANMWMGVARPEYSFSDELPIFLLIFLLPAAAAVFVNWKFF
jgi:heme A synthase